LAQEQMNDGYTATPEKATNAVPGPGTASVVSPLLPAPEGASGHWHPAGHDHLYQTLVARFELPKFGEFKSSSQ